MSDPFTHLHVASGYSLRYGASHPHVLVERAAGHGMTTLALTDRDGVYGAVKFAKACQTAGVRPIFGVDLAVEPLGLLHPAGPVRGPVRRTPARRTPARGGAVVDPRRPRVTVLAQDRQGWAALCRLVSATHLAGERGQPVATLDLLAEHAGGVRVVLHCFSMPSRLDECLARGYWISFAGNATYPRNAELAAAVARVPLDRLLVETDAPYLSPQPVRKHSNQPAHVVHTAAFVAERRGISYEQLEAAVEDNAARLFGW